MLELQHHADNFNIAQLFVQRLHLVDMGGVDGDRDGVVVAFAARFNLRVIIPGSMALHHFNQAADKGEDYRLFLLQMAQEVGIEPDQLLYLRKLVGRRVTVIE